MVNRIQFSGSTVVKTQGHPDLHRGLFDLANKIPPGDDDRVIGLFGGDVKGTYIRDSHNRFWMTPLDKAVKHLVETYCQQHHLDQQTLYAYERDSTGGMDQMERMAKSLGIDV